MPLLFPGRLAIDVAAAGRFIKHAITQARKAPIPSTDDVPEPDVPSIHVPVRVTTKMLEREEYLQKVREADEESEEDQVLEMFDDVPPEPSSSTEENFKPMDVDMDMDEQHLETMPMLPKETSATGKRRHNIDPFTGKLSLGLEN